MEQRKTGVPRRRRRTEKAVADAEEVDGEGADCLDDSADPQVQRWPVAEPGKIRSRGGLQAN